MRIIFNRLLILFGLVLFANTAAAQEVSDEFIKTYRAYDSAFRQGDLERAAEMAQRTLAIAKKEVGEKHEKIPVLQINLGHVLALLGRADEALPHLLAAREAFASGTPEEQANLITIHEDLAGIYASKEELDKAREELQAAIIVRTRVNGTKDPELASLLSSLAIIDINQDKLDAAEGNYNDALQLLEGILGRDHPRIASVLSQKGDLAMLRKENDKAEKFYLEALSILQKNYLPDDRNVVTMHAKLANYYIGINSKEFADHADAVIKNTDFEDGQALPAFIIKPDSAAIGSDATGSVLLEFTVTTEGKILYPRVLESNPAGRFDEATLAAARAWRFRPKVIEGERQEQPKTRARVVFNNGNIRVHLGEAG